MSTKVKTAIVGVMLFVCMPYSAFAYTVEEKQVIIAFLIQQVKVLQEQLKELLEDEREREREEQRQEERKEREIEEAFHALQQLHMKVRDFDSCSVTNQSCSKFMKSYNTAAAELRDLNQIVPYECQSYHPGFSKWECITAN